MEVGPHAHLNNADEVGDVMARQRARRPSGPRVRVTQIRSLIGYDWRQEAVVRGLGLRRIGHTVEVSDTPSMRGMIHKVRHLVRIED